MKGDGGRSRAMSAPALPANIAGHRPSSPGIVRDYGLPGLAAIPGRPSCVASVQLAWYTSRAIFSIFS